MSLPTVPDFEKPPALSPYLRNLTKELDKELRQRAPDTTGVGGVYLVAPNGSVWKVSVSNTGVLSTAQVSG